MRELDRRIDRGSRYGSQANAKKTDHVVASSTRLPISTTRMTDSQRHDMFMKYGVIT
jgi:hypothetical protein